MPFTYVLWVYLFKDTPWIYFVTLTFAVFVLLKNLLAPNKKLRTLIWVVQTLFILICSVIIFIFNATQLPYLYPVIINLSIALSFMYTLYKPPYMIETFMRLRKESLTQDEVSYAKRLTIIWFIFSIFNACVSLWTLSISMNFWMLYNGLIAYILMGVLLLSGFAYPYIKKKYD